MSLQRFRGTQSGQITAADASVHAFPTLVVGIVYLQAGPENVGTVSISASNVGQAYATGGLVLGATSPVQPIGPIENFEAISYQFTNVGDVLNWFAIN